MKFERPTRIWIKGSNHTISAPALCRSFTGDLKTGHLIFETVDGTSFMGKLPDILHEYRLTTLDIETDRRVRGFDLLKQPVYIADPKKIGSQ